MKGTYLNLSISGAVVTVRGVVAADNLNLRAGAGTGYSAKTMMAAGTAVGIKGAAKTAAAQSGTVWPLQRTAHSMMAMHLQIMWRSCVHPLPMRHRLVR